MIRKAKGRRETRRTRKEKTMAKAKAINPNKAAVTVRRKAPEVKEELAVSSSRKVQ